MLCDLDCRHTCHVIQNGACPWSGEPSGHWIEPGRGLTTQGICLSDSGTEVCGYGVTRDMLELEGVDSDYEALTIRSESDSIDSEVSTISGVSTDGSGVSEAGSVNGDQAGSSVEDPEAEVSLSNEFGVDRQEVQKKHPKPLVFTKDSLGSSETHDAN